MKIWNVYKNDLKEKDSDVYKDIEEIEELAAGIFKMTQKKEALESKEPKMSNGVHSS